MRRPLFGSIASAAAGSSGPSRSTQVLDAVLGELRLEPRSDRRVGRRDLEPVEGRAHVEAGAADQDRDAVRGARMAAMSARERRWYAATLASSRDVEHVELVVHDPAALGRRAAWPCRCPCRGRAASRRR